MSFLNKANMTIQCNTLISLTIPSDYFPSIVAGFLLLYIITISSNCILIYTLRKTKQLNTISNKLILMLSVSDLGLGAIAFPAAVASSSLRDNYKRCVFKKIGFFLIQIFSYLSFLILTCISIDRYLRVTKMNRYNLYMNKYRMIAMILISFLIAAMVSTVSLVRPSFEQQIFVVCFDVVVVGFTGVVYMFLLKRLQSHVKNLRKAMSNSLRSKTGGETKLAGTSVAVALEMRIKGCDKMVGKSEPRTFRPMPSGEAEAAGTNANFQESSSRFLRKSGQTNVTSMQSKGSVALETNSTNLKQSEHYFRVPEKSKPNIDTSRPNEEPMSTNMNSTFLKPSFKLLRKSRHCSKMPLESKDSVASGTNGSVIRIRTGRSQENTNKELSAVKTIQVLLVLIFVTYVPYNISSLLWTYQKLWKKEDPGLKLELFYFWSSFVSVSNGGINAWIIIFGNTKSRRFVASMFRKKRVSNVIQP